MREGLVALVSGILFGTGLAISGMMDPTRVRGFLDILGNWDPTLAFVMGGAIIPMFFAWRYSENRQPLLGGNFPAKPAPKLGRNLILGSTLFGMGWGLAGLCPGPSVASLSYGGWPHWVFFLAMVCGMLMAPRVRETLDTMVPAE